MIIWSLLIFLAMLAQRQFAYYFAVNIAVLSGYFAWWILELVGFGNNSVAVDVKLNRTLKKAERIRQARARGGPLKPGRR